MYIFGVSWDLSSTLKIVFILVVFGYVVYKIYRSCACTIKKDDIFNDVVYTKWMSKKKEMVICPGCGFIHYDENNPWTKNRNEEYLNNKKTSEVNGKNNND
nr:hypothetical protein [uncultured Campylobacter sp.]